MRKSVHPPAVGCKNWQGREFAAEIDGGGEGCGNRHG
ncbi:hypothetical protein BVRB_5g114630 [Beta vulgaris subsp. vulgaris]|nr:hypothetical protein BVRB_5g114630 [Beta vulgaris subsp. vulgaris]